MGVRQVGAGQLGSLESEGREREREEDGSWCVVAGEFLEVQRGGRRRGGRGLKKAVAVHAGEGGGLSI
jgi:hypothetical protein